MRTYSSLLLLRKTFGFCLLMVTVILSSCKDEPDPNKPVYNPTAYTIVKPTGFPDPDIPADNPMTVEGIALGKRLFQDKNLSGDGTLSCEGCHNPDNNFSDQGKAISEGIKGGLGNRNAMSLMNLAFNRPRLMWDGRHPSLEVQASDPINNKLEMAGSFDKIIPMLQADASYKDAFFKAFGDHEITQLLVTKAIAQFERTLISGKAPVDRNLTPAQKRGQLLFFNDSGGDCFHCHGIPGTFTDGDFHNNGLDAATVISDFKDPGLGGFTKRPQDYGKFQTPSLRNISQSAPYMHDGRFNTLEEVIEHYSSGIKDGPNIDPNIQEHVGGLRLNPGEKADLLAFLLALTDD